MPRPITSRESTITRGNSVSILLRKLALSCFRACGDPENTVAGLLDRARRLVGDDPNVINRRFTIARWANEQMVGAGRFPIEEHLHVQRQNVNLKNRLTRCARHDIFSVKVSCQTQSVDTALCRRGKNDLEL